MAWKAVETIPIRIHGRISPERAHAVREALLPRVFPVVRIIDGRAEPLATASMVADGDTHALLTAAHAFDCATVGDLAVPLPNDGTWAFLRSTRSRVFVHPKRDIALVILEEPAFIRRLRAALRRSKYRSLFVRKFQKMYIQLRAQLHGRVCRQLDSELHLKLREPLNAALHHAMFATLFETSFEKTFSALFGSEFDSKFRSLWASTYLAQYRQRLRGRRPGDKPLHGRIVVVSRPRLPHIVYVLPDTHVENGSFTGIREAMTIGRSISQLALRRRRR